MSLLDKEDELIEKIDARIEARLEFEYTMRKTLDEIFKDFSEFKEFCVIKDKTNNKEYKL